MSAEPGFPKTVRVGGLERDALLHALHGHEVRLNRAAEVLFQDARFVTAAREHVLEVHALSGHELGFSEGFTYQLLVARARDAGFQECPLELGPHLRMQFPDQREVGSTHGSVGDRAPRGSITVASAPLDTAAHTPRGFYLLRGDGLLWLRGYWASTDHVWHPEDVLVFCRTGCST